MKVYKLVQVDLNQIISEEKHINEKFVLRLYEHETEIGIYNDEAGHAFEKMTKALKDMPVKLYVSIKHEVYPKFKVIEVDPL